MVELGYPKKLINLSRMTLSHVRVRVRIRNKLSEPLKTVGTSVAKRYSSTYFLSDVIVFVDLRRKVNIAVDSLEVFSIHLERMARWSVSRQ